MAVGLTTAFLRSIKTHPNSRSRATADDCQSAIKVSFTNNADNLDIEEIYTPINHVDPGLIPRYQCRGRADHAKAPRKNRRLY
jgi:hypothetical protein